MSSYEWARPGVKVVCIRDIRSDLCPHLLNGSVFTIREVILGGRVDKSGNNIPELPKTVSIKLSEVDSGRFYYLLDGSFKPLVTKKLPDSLTILLEKPRRVIIPDQFDYNKEYDPV